MDYQQQKVIEFNNISAFAQPITTNFLSQFTNWAKIWVSPYATTTTIDKNIPCKRKNELSTIDSINNTHLTITAPNSSSLPSREIDIRCRINYYDSTSDNNETLCKNLFTIPIPQRAFLYRATHQKLQPNHHQYNINDSSSNKYLLGFGDLIHILHFWDNLEHLMYGEQQEATIPPSKRLPFLGNFDRSGSVARRGKKAAAVRYLMNTYSEKSKVQKRKSFVSSTIVYTPNATNGCIRVLPCDVPETLAAAVEEEEKAELATTTKLSTPCITVNADDDDDVPLGSLTACTK